MCWSYVERVGLGHLCLSPSVLYDMTFDEFHNAIEGRRELEDMRQRGEWERIRWQTCVLLQPNIKKGTSLTPQKLLPLAWDNETASPAPTSDDIKASLERIKKRDGKVR